MNSRAFFIACILFTQIATLTYANTLFDEYKTTLLRIKNDTATIKDTPQITIGSSGIITHSFDATKTIILSHVEVVKKDGKYATLKLSPFTLLDQDAFPKAGILPKAGDKVILNYLYSRAFIVAPNERVYNETLERFSDITWLHPDLMAAYLSIEYKPNPSLEDFTNMCNQNSVGVIFFALKEHGYFVDCYDKKILKKVTMRKINSYQLPFFNRLGKIETIFWKLNGRQIKEYNSYYKKLIGVENDR